MRLYERWIIAFQIADASWTAAYDVATFGELPVPRGASVPSDQLRRDLEVFFADKIEVARMMVEGAAKSGFVVSIPPGKAA